MKTILLVLAVLASSAIHADTWKYKTHSGRHSQVKIQNWGGGYKISALLYYTDGYFEGYYPWEGLIDSNSISNSKIIVQNAQGVFQNGSLACTVPIEIILHLPAGSTTINDFYMEYKIPVQNVDDIGSCTNPDYDWHRDIFPYQIN